LRRIPTITENSDLRYSENFYAGQKRSNHEAHGFQEGLTQRRRPAVRPIVMRGERNELKTRGPYTPRNFRISADTARQPIGR
jgi:hypothetical protein